MMTPFDVLLAGIRHTTAPLPDDLFEHSPMARVTLFLARGGALYPNPYHPDARDLYDAQGAYRGSITAQMITDWLDELRRPVLAAYTLDELPGLIGEDPHP